MSWKKGMFSAQSRRERINYWASLQLRELWPLLTAVFLLFSSIGFLTDLVQLGKLSLALVFTWAVFSGLVAVAYIVVLARTPKLVPVVVGVQVALTWALSALSNYLDRRPDFHLTDPNTNIRIAAIATLVVVVTSYTFFLMFIQSTGTKAVRTQTELAVAHKIQQRLVPVIDVKNSRFEIFAQSRPSEKVGGDLAGFVERAGVTYAYVADVSGHGMQSGLLMNMLTTAIRTALLDAPDLVPMLHRVNSVLPEIKEPQMYTTFAGLRFRNTSEVEVALCGHPPILWFRNETGTVTELSHSELPLGLFAAADFSSVQANARAGDIYALVTDGILEANNEKGEEFGMSRVRELLVNGARMNLAMLAQQIFQAVDGFGKQEDDQTLLLMRVL